ncbi:uncharacterized protein FOMMEDRAFT_171420, partial [Fomitiporia mediterranea MF3/22]|uniref:uncharacterized protein n=1 Tax=Fomitiporia mediterranea (strain MF3/22) TaxID=694068 RepID=UPI00044081FB
MDATSKNLSASSSQEDFTIIRIKRKRSEDVPDVLVVDKKGSKRRKSGLNVFQFAETVDEATWRRIEQEELRNRISSLSKSGPKTGQKRKEPTSPVALSRQTSSQTNGTARQYRVVTQETPPKRPSRFYPTPPKVLSSKAVDKARSKIRIYDAELASDEAGTTVDPEMEKFQTLLQDYLKVHDDIPSNAEERRTEGASNTRTQVTPSTPGDYVYDIFYQRPSTLSERADLANMATLTGLPPAFDEDEDFGSESEVEDEADEDSNAEDFYKNDYPDEESSASQSEGSDLYSEDEFHEPTRFEADD